MHIMKESDYHEHVQTYRGFVKGGTITAVVVAVVLVLMALFLL